MRSPILLALVATLLLRACSAFDAPFAVPAPSPTAIVAAPREPTAPAPTSQPGTSPTGAPDATTFPDPGAFTWTLVADGFESPVDIQFPPDGSGRMFVVEQPGRIRIADSTGVARSPFLDLTDRVNSGGNEQGLLGLAFHPRYPETGVFFVNYTDYHDHNVIARFQTMTDASFADPASETILLSIDDPYANHNGGVLAFGPDGYLYAGLGDGGSANDPQGNGQNTNSLLGKILRLDVDGGEPFAVPTDNPYVRGGGSPEVWAYGLRNPWRFSFDVTTGDLYIADVGQGTWEEVDFLAAGAPGGANFGWNFREGAHESSGSPPAGATLIDPVAEYSHSEGGCSITGGYVYRGSMPEWNGIYLYADFCTGLLWGLLHSADVNGTPWQSQLLYDTGANITTFGQDLSGEVYLADRAGGIYRLERRP